MLEKFAVVQEYQGGLSMVAFCDTLEKAKADAARRTSANNNSEGIRFHVYQSIGYYGKPITPPLWNDANTTATATPEAPPARK